MTFDLMKSLRHIQDDERVDFHTRGTCEIAADEIERLNAAYLAHIQMENACKRTGKPCREPTKCGCHLECAALIMDAPTVPAGQREGQT